MYSIPGSRLLLLPDSWAFSRTGLSAAESPPRGPEICLPRQSTYAQEEVEDSGPQVFPGLASVLRQNLVRLARVPGSERLGCVIIDQVLCVLSGGNSGTGWCGRWLVQGTVEVLFLVLEETVAQDGQDHYDTDGQQYSNSYLHGACTGNRAFPPKTEHILLGDATTGLKTLLFLLKVVLVPVATTIGEAGTAFTEWVVIPAWDVLLAKSSVWQLCTVPFVTEEVDTLKFIKAAAIFFTGGLIGAIRAVRRVITL